MKISKSDLSELFDLVDEKTLSLQEVIDLINAHGGESAKRNEVFSEMSLTVDYGRSFWEMTEVGKYGWKWWEIKSSNFCIPDKLSGKKITVLAKLFQLKDRISTDDAIYEINKAGYRPANFAELLALGEAFPILPQNFFAVALGTVYRSVSGDDTALGIHVTKGNGRWLDLDNMTTPWEDRFHFLAVRK